MRNGIAEELLRGNNPVDTSAEMRAAMRIMQEDNTVAEAVEIVERRMGVDDLGSLLTHMEVDVCGSRNVAAELDKYKTAWERLRARIAQEAEHGTAVYVRDVCSDLLREMDGEIPGKVAVL